MSASHKRELSQSKLSRLGSSSSLLGTVGIGSGGAGPALGSSAPGSPKTPKTPKTPKSHADAPPIEVNAFNCANASQELIRRVAAKYKWEPTRSDKADLFWSDQRFARTLFREDGEAHRIRRINQLPDMGHLCTKDVSNHLLDFFRALAPEEFDFYPKTWDLSTQKAEFKREFKKGQTYILKPSSGRQGAGIMLVQDMAQVDEALRKNAQTKWIVQEYLDDPLLLDGYKLDLRVYVMLESVNPLKVHVFRDGLARL